MTTQTETGICRHCDRTIVRLSSGEWIDPQATGDDRVWRHTCDSHDTFTAEHEPRARCAQWFNGRQCAQAQQGESQYCAIHRADVSARLNAMHAGTYAPGE